MTEKVAGDARKVLEFVTEKEIEILQDRKVECSEESAWDLAAMATMVCARAGAYRGDSGLILTYMTFDEVEIVPEP